MSRRNWLIVLLLGALLNACSPAPQTAQVPSQPTNSPPATATATSTSAPTSVPPTLIPTVDSTPLPAATEPPAGSVTATPPTEATAPTVIAQGQEVLTIPAGSGSDQVGITAADGPTTFRVAADGSIRIMDTVNKRLLFFNAARSGQSFKLVQTIDLAFLQRPTDFVVTGNGDLYVLDAQGWTLTHLSIAGKILNTLPLNPATSRAFTTISLTADGRIIGLAEKTGYILATPSGPISLEDQPNAQLEGTVTVRSNAIFAVVGDAGNQNRKSLLINYGGIEPAIMPLGNIDGQVSFLDINQGMEPYMMVEHGSITEIRRYDVAGQFMGTLALDLTNCRAIARSVYVDRPGDVYTMCVGDQGVTITRYAMLNDQGQPLPRYDQLIERALWSPGNLQSAPG